MIGPAPFLINCPQDWMQEFGLSNVLWTVSEDRSTCKHHIIALNHENYWRCCTLALILVASIYVTQETGAYRKVVANTQAC